MNRIKKHLFSAEDNVPVYADQENKKVLGYLSEGEWLGVIEETETLFFIASSKHVGYVNIADCIELLEGSFRVNHEGENPVYYGL